MKFIKLKEIREAKFIELFKEKENLTKNILLWIGIFLIIAILARKIVYNPQVEKIKTIEKQIAEEKEKTYILKEIGKIERALNFYRSPASSEEATWILDEITRIAKDTGVRIIALEPRASEEQKVYIKLPIKLMVECSYHELGYFLSQIERSKRFLKIDELQAGRERIDERIDKRRNIEIKEPLELDKLKVTLLVNRIYLER